MCPFSINTEECKAELLKYFDKDNIEIAGNGDILSFFAQRDRAGQAGNVSETEEALMCGKWASLVNSFLANRGN